MVIIKHARKSLLYDNNEPWMKNDTGLFDITMGAFNGAEVYELVGTFLLYKLSQKYHQTTWFFIAMMVWLFSKTLVAQNKKKLKRIFKSYLRKMN